MKCIGSFGFNSLFGLCIKIILFHILYGDSMLTLPIPPPSPKKKKIEILILIFGIIYFISYLKIHRFIYILLNMASSDSKLFFSNRNHPFFH